MSTRARRESSMSQPAVRRWVGKPIKTKEDRRFVQGKGLYSDDIQLKRTLYAAVLRSPHAHANIKSIDISKAARLEGVVATLAGPELPGLTNPMRSRTGYPIKEYAMAVEKAVYAGQPVAAVAAESRGIAEDALDLIQVEYEELPAVVDPEEAMKPGAPRIFKDVPDNVFSSLNLEYGDVGSAFRDADLVLSERFSVHRYSSTPLEPDTAMAHYDQAQNTLTFYCNATGTGSLRAQTRGFPVKDVKVRYVIPDTGGTFGERWSVSLQDMTIVSLLSWKTGRPVKYVKDRKEMLMAGTNGARDAVYRMDMALKKDGTILGHRLKDVTNEGGSGYYAGYYNAIKLTNITGLYRMKSIALEAYSVATNKGPGGSNRGLSKPHMGFVLERMVDLAAKRLGLDPAEIRRRNFIRPDELPYRTPSGNTIDAGNFHELLEKALGMVGYERWRGEQKKMRRAGRHVGIGIACNVDPGGANPGREQMVRGGPDLPGQRLTGATVRMDPLGKVTVQIGATNWGQSHETTTAQVVADELGVSPDDVEVSSVFDSFSNPWSGTSGTGADSFTSIDMGAIVAAARKVRAKIQKFAAHMLDAKPEEIQLDDGKAFVQGSRALGPDRRRRRRRVRQGEGRDAPARGRARAPRDRLLLLSLRGPSRRQEEGRGPQQLREPGARRRRRGRRRDGEDVGAEVRGHARRGGPDQSHGRRGADTRPRRPHPLGGAEGGDGLERRRADADRDLQRLPEEHRCGHARRRGRPPGVPVPLHGDREQGGRGGADHPRLPGHRKRGRGRAVRLWGEDNRPSAHAGERLVDDPGGASRLKREAATGSGLPEAAPSPRGVERRAERPQSATGLTARGGTCR